MAGLAAGISSLPEITEDWGVPATATIGVKTRKCLYSVGQGRCSEPFFVTIYFSVSCRVACLCLNQWKVLEVGGYHKNRKYPEN